MPLEVGLLFKMPYSKSMILHFTEYWKIIVFPPSFCMCSLQYLRGIWILTWNLVIWDTLWAAQSFPVNWLPVPSFHQGYSGRGAHDAAREIGGIREYGEAQVQKMYRNVFKTWCPPALMRILMTTNLPPPMLIIVPWIGMRLERCRKVTWFHCTLQIHSAFLLGSHISSNSGKSLNGEYSI